MIVKIITEDDELQQAMQIRIEVFVKEQGVPLEAEIDEFDTINGRVAHVLVYHHDQTVGTGRILFMDGYGKLGRICILPTFRKLSLGKEIIKALEEIALDHGLDQVRLHGQTHAEGFYHKLGYQTASDVFMEEGIPHVLMVKKLILQ
ncbi:GNAT family N-acetyltransferase [Dehalobacterium formicoaceticum]|uniref:GNAT family N-acetyltransferase n=1 Tax=Dehalobacterium formicoaceticum TaxID=51515 RepID=A0ABT1Y097_9FIRM|nr:GNAT family N-acetyltransferase [Dehalobacterium formicoaceticum]MCR6544275.1 GNAT family N-acetyltransferase [Dehalobacterium formicoaceticum]